MVKAYINSDQSPCLIEGDEDTGFISIIMPMKI
jgi:DNA polymerase-3 subunit beta